MTIVLSTKLHQPPPPSNRVERPHLLALLEEGRLLGRQLTLVSAPAGFGKTTCISAWVQHAGLTSVWYSLDRSDDDPIHFFSYLITGLQRIAPQWGQDLASALESGQLPSMDALTSILINDLLKSERPFLLILDDFQVIQDPWIMEVLKRLIANQPPLLHLVLITREDPLLPLARLRANNRMTELRAADLRFQSLETASFLNEQMGLRLSSQDVDALENRTEGWIAGLQLAALSLRGRSDPTRFISELTGTHRYILSYLIEEVLSQQPQEVQDFLLQTSILDQFNEALCEVVTGRPDSAVLLEKLLTANLFLIPLDNESGWYRYHHLFADLLRSQQARTHKSREGALHLRASQWYEQGGMAGKAIHHALAGEHWQRALSLLEKHALSLVNEGYAKTVEGWMQALPTEWQSHSPKANLAFAWMHLLRGNFPAVMPYLEQAENAIARADPIDPAAKALYAEWCALQSNLLHLRGRAKESLTYAQQALQEAEPDNAYLQAVAGLGLGGAHRLAGDFPQAQRAYQAAIQASQAAGHTVAEMLAASGLTLMAVQHGLLSFTLEVNTPIFERMERIGLGLPPIAGTLYGVIGSVEYERNQVEPAQQKFLRGIQLSTFSGHNTSLIYIKILLARLLLGTGEVQAAFQTTQEAFELLQGGGAAWLWPELTLQQVRVLLAQNNPGQAQAVLEAVEPRSFQPMDFIQLARLNLGLYQIKESSSSASSVLKLAGCIISEAEQSQRMGIALQAYLLRAQIYAALSQLQAALKDLERALQIGEPEGYVRSFVDEGPGVAALLQPYRPQLAQAAYVQHLLQAFHLPTPPLGPGNDLIEPLSERELEVLRLMAEGLKYEEMAERMVVTVNTIRFHIKAIYNKLSVNNRTRALEAARGYGLI